MDAFYTFQLLSNRRYYGACAIYPGSMETHVIVEMHGHGTESRVTFRRSGSHDDFNAVQLAIRTFLDKN